MADTLEMAESFSDINAALDYLFSSFTNRHTLHINKHDSEFRRPEVIIELARKFNILPDATRTCLVTGSKGKGTVSRMIAWNLSASGFQVGLVVTPEEVTHLDRIRIGDKIIPAQDFCRILNVLRPALETAVNEQVEDFYFSPAGIFLVVALMWFKEQAVDTWVIEGGRGVKFDEIGQIDAAVGVVTNILPEHLTRIGPTLEDIAMDKLSLVIHCQNLVVSASVLSWQHLLQNYHGKVQVAQTSHHGQKTAERPQWFDELDCIAYTAAQHLGLSLAWQHFDTPAFFFASGTIYNGRVTVGAVCCDAAIHPDCLDIEFLKRTGLSEGAVLIGLSKDKDGEGIVSKLTAAGFQHLYTVALSSQVGHIYTWVADDETVRLVAKIEVIGDSDANLSELVRDLAHRHTSLYVVGVQLFIRTMRQMLGVEVVNPKSWY